MKYRNTPTSTTGKPPTDFIFRFRPRTILDILTHPNNPSSPRQISHQTQKEQPTKQVRQNTKYTLGEMVLYRHEFKTEIKWLKAKISAILSECRYRIILITKNSMRDCHGDQLRPYHEKEFYSQLPIAAPRTDELSDTEEQEETPQTQIESDDLGQR